MNQNQKTKLNENAISLEEFSHSFSEKQKRDVEKEIRYYDLVISLKKIRIQKGLTQAKLALKARLPRTTIAKIESGKYNPTLQTLTSIVSAMSQSLYIGVCDKSVQKYAVRKNKKQKTHNTLEI